MNDSTVNFTIKASSNSTAHSIGKIDILETCMLTFNFISGLPTNAYVIWLIMTGTGNGVASEFFNLNLSVCGIFVSVNALLILASKWFPFQSLTALTQFFFGLTVTGHPLFQCLMCVERYLAVVHPVTFLKFKPLRYRVICCTVAWIFIFGTCLFCMFSFISFTIHMYIWFYSLQFLLFLSIQLFCLVAVLRALKQSGPGERRGEREEENQMKRRAFYIIRVITASLVITYVPYIATGLHYLVTLQVIQILWSISYICFMLAGFVHLALYLHRTGKLFCFCSKND
ncbi:uracil nucleotide/cysteinyl leukotriene receptor-like [Rhinichthys klamathensis goyatoka]|uniref:uracil nucleotide/cysteinyl leukotriene receptor-like n=1 Tax=Rhinichthys klamathensis goyatoka TaxID=3034132 RepID=UPI0024B48208|nr:uracil nucleotide/cysteinyl leukotriene receptor-like [Rhinichthys klamathensis goyatoka]